MDEQEIRRLLLATAARDVDAFARLYQRCAPLPVTVQFYPRTNHVTLLGAFAAPLRFLAPVLDDVGEFVQAAPKR